MENFKIFVIIFIILTIFYFIESVPFCRLAPDNGNHSEKAVYSTNEVLEIKSYNLTLLYVRGISMLPTIQDNSQCLCVKKKSYMVGDIIFFTLRYNGENMAIAHRINSINGEEIITKGDNNNFTDPVINSENIICSVPKIPRYLTLIR